MNTFITIILALFIVCLLALLFLWVKTPYYRVDKARMIQVLEMVLTGQATENDWRITFGLTVRHDPELEAVRQVCSEIEQQHFIENNTSDYLFSRQGLEELKQQLLKLKQNNK